MTSPPWPGSPIRLAALLFSCFSTLSAVTGLLSLLSTPYSTACSFPPASFGNSSVSTLWSCCCFPSPLCPSSVLLCFPSSSLLSAQSSLSYIHPLLFFLPPLSTLSDWLALFVQPLGPYHNLSLTLSEDMEESHIPKLSLSEGIRFQGHPPLPSGSPPVLMRPYTHLVWIVPLSPPLLLSHVFHHSDSNNTIQDSVSVGKPETVSNPSKNSSCLCWSELMIYTDGVMLQIRNTEISTAFKQAF